MYLKKHMVLCCLKQHLPIATTRFASSHSLHGAATHWGALVHDSRSTAKNLVYQQIVDFHKNTKTIQRGWFSTNLLTSTNSLGFLMGVFHTFHLFFHRFHHFPSGFASAPRPWPAAPSAPASSERVATEPARAVSSAWGLTPSIKQ